MDKANYNLIYKIDTPFADPICAMNMNDKYVITGTMKGKITALNLSNKKMVDLAELSNEPISSITFKDNSIFISIGDEEVDEYIDKTIDSSNIPKKYPIYRNDVEHSKSCFNSYVMMSGGILFKIGLAQFEEGDKEIIAIKCNFEYKNISIKESTFGCLDMSTNSIPFDFDTKRFLWVDIYSKIKRQICVANVPNAYDTWKYELNEQFGHISQAKLLKDNRVFIVRKMTQCEIHKIDQNFSLEVSFKHIGDEVISVFLCLFDFSQLNTDMLTNKVQIHTNFNEYYLKMYTNNMQPKESEVIIHEDQKPKNEENIIIALLDIDGNINLYENHILSKKFNLNQIKNIPKEHKDKQFFRMGYSYYIKYIDGIYCITSDHGCYVITDRKIE